MSEIEILIPFIYKHSFTTCMGFGDLKKRKSDYNFPTYCLDSKINGRWIAEDRVKHSFYKIFLGAFNPQDTYLETLQIIYRMVKKRGNQIWKLRGRGLEAWRNMHHLYLSEAAITTFKICLQELVIFFLNAVWLLVSSLLPLISDY